MKEFGIDISAWQGNYNLRRAKDEGVKFVIIKGGGGDDGLYKDSRFEQNYQKAKDLRLPVGVYWFSRALSVEAAREEAAYFYEKCLKGRQFELPVYIDVENKRQLNLGKRVLTDIILTWLNYLENKNYYVGIYSSASFFRTYMYDDELRLYPHWVAQWAKAYTGDAGLWQFGGETNFIRSNKVAGQTTDQNYMLKDYPTFIKKSGLNGFGSDEKPQPTPTPKKLTVDGIIGPESVKAWQEWAGTYADGEISGQLKTMQKYLTAITAITWTEEGSPFVRALQNYLNGKGYKCAVDSYLGAETVKAWQKFLIKNGTVLTVDGYFGVLTAKATQVFFNSR